MRLFIYFILKRYFKDIKCIVLRFYLKILDHSVENVYILYKNNTYNK